MAAKEARKNSPFISQINETAAFCWRLLEDGIDSDSLFLKMLAEYEIVDPAAARADLEELLEQMKKANYLIEEP